MKPESDKTTNGKSGEQELKDAIGLLNLALDAGNAGTWDWNIVNNTFHWSPQFLKIFGMEPSVVPGFEAWSNVVHPEDREIAAKRIQDSIDTRTELKNEYRIILKNNEVRWIQAVGNTYYSEDKPVRMIGLCTDITEIRKAEQTLKASEEKFRNVFDNSAVGKSITGIDGSINVNAAFCQMIGYTKEELEERTWQSITHPDDIELTQKNIGQLLSGEKKSARFIKRYLKKEGSIIWADVNTVLQRDKEGKPLYFITALVDITEQKLAETSLHNVSSRLEALLSAVPEIIMEVDINRVYTWANKAGYDFFGEDVIGKEASFYFEGEQDTYQKVEPLFQGDESVIYVESRQRRRDGQKRLLGWWCRVLKGKEEYPVGGLSSARDITEIRKAENEVAEEKERLMVTLRSIGDAVIATDVQGNIALMNKVAEELTGWTLSEAIGKPLTEVFHIVSEITREPCPNPVEKVLVTGQIIELANHTLLVSRDGTERIIADSGAPIRDKDSRITGVVLVFRDMTEKNKMLNNMHRIDRLDSLAVLAGGIAHDFNNLLAGIFGYIEIAREKSSADTTVSKYLDKALTVFERAKDLTQQLLTFSRGGAPNRKTAQLEKLVRENTEFVLSGSNVSWGYHIDQDLWLCDFDEYQISQVIDNIVINAQQAMPAGGTIVISMNNVSLKDGGNSALREGNYIKVSITDTGTGIPKNILNRIFDPFFTTKQKGNGLGLATCYSIIKNHDGCIDVESIPGKGTTFHVFLPASEKFTVQNVSRLVSQHKGMGSILVMDDEDFMRKIVGNMLTSMGYNFIEAKNGEEALQLCVDAIEQDKAITGALFDLTIPGGMGGKQTIVELRRKFPDMPVFASSGFSEDPVMANPTEFGFTDSIRKPFKKDELAEMLNKHLKI